MALIDRVKERTKTELGDGELQELIDEASAEIVRRYGEASAEITEVLEGGFVSIVPTHPVDPSEDVTIVETATDELELEPDDFVTRGRRVVRLASGTNARSAWGDTVSITYTPIDDTPQREEVIIKLVILSINYEGVKSDSIDGYSSTHVDYQSERERLLASLDRSVKMA